MNILLATHEFPPFPGGVARYCCSVAEAAARNGHSVSVLAPLHADIQPAETTPEQGIKVLRFAGGTFDFTLSNLMAARSTLAAALSKSRYDVVHAADWPMLLALNWIKRLGELRIATFHGTDAFVLKESVKARLSGSNRAVEKFDRVAFNSHFTQRTVIGMFPSISKRDNRVTHLGVDDYWFEPASGYDKSDFERLIQRRPDDRVVLTVARIDSRKGQLDTVLALAQMPAEWRSRVIYVVVGKPVDIGYQEALTKAAHEAGVRLVLTGRLEDRVVRAAYASSDAFSLMGVAEAKKIEGFGLVLLEAAAQGLPVVATRVNAIPEVVAPGISGVLLEGKDHARAALEFHSVLFGPAGLAIRGSAVEHARRFSWDRCAAATYDELKAQPLT